MRFDIRICFSGCFDVAKLCGSRATQTEQVRGCRLCIVASYLEERCLQENIKNQRADQFLHT